MSTHRLAEQRNTAPTHQRLRRVLSPRAAAGCLSGSDISSRWSTGDWRVWNASSSGIIPKSPQKS